MGRIILTVGLPRSGKSTWARAQGLPIVNPDAVRLAMHGQAFLAEAEPWVWQMAYTMAKALLLAGHETIIVDATNTTAKRRDAWGDRFPGHEIVEQVFPVHPDLCMKRAAAGGWHDLIPVIVRMANEWDGPPWTEGVP